MGTWVPWHPTGLSVVPMLAFKPYPACVPYSIVKVPMVSIAAMLPHIAGLPN